MIASHRMYTALTLYHGHFKRPPVFRSSVAEFEPPVEVRAYFFLLAELNLYLLCKSEPLTLTRANFRCTKNCFVPLKVFMKISMKYRDDIFHFISDSWYISIKYRDIFFNYRTFNHFSVWVRRTWNSWRRSRKHTRFQRYRSHLLRRHVAGDKFS